MCTVRCPIQAEVTGDKIEFTEVLLVDDGKSTKIGEPTVAGAKVTAEQDGSVTPSLTVDTKQLRDKRRYTPPEKLLDQAIENFLKNSNV